MAGDRVVDKPFVDGFLSGDPTPDEISTLLNEVEADLEKNAKAENLPLLETAIYFHIKLLEKELSGRATDQHGVLSSLENYPSNMYYTFSQEIERYINSANLYLKRFEDQQETGDESITVHTEFSFLRTDLLNLQAIHARINDDDPFPFLKEAQIRGSEIATENLTYLSQNSAESVLPASSLIELAKLELAKRMDLPTTAETNDTISYHVDEYRKNSHRTEGQSPIEALLNEAIDSLEPLIPFRPEEDSERQLAEAYILRGIFKHTEKGRNPIGDFEQAETLGSDFAASNLAALLPSKEVLERPDAFASGVQKNPSQAASEGVAFRPTQTDLGKKVIAFVAAIRARGEALQSQRFLKTLDRVAKSSVSLKTKNTWNTVRPPIFSTIRTFEKAARTTADRIRGKGPQR